VDTEQLASHPVVILAEQIFPATQVAMLTAWVEDGGQLIAMRPAPELAPLLGLAGPAGTLANAYLAIDTAAAPGTGLVAETIQFHGTADRYTLAGASELATLYSDADTVTPHPAVTLHSVGSRGGHAAAFTYDLARSIVYTRQGDPAAAGQERDGGRPTTPGDLFFPGWLDVDKIAIPQADEQQRLLANLILMLSGPLPRFWYFPSGHRAVVTMTADQHGCCAGTSERFETELAAAPPDCSVLDWECVRSSSYIYPGSGMSEIEALLYTAEGFELGVHVNTDCTDWTPATLESFFATQLATFSAQFPSLRAPDTLRMHCLAWSDWLSVATTGLAHGIRLDTTYYHWPPWYTEGRPGFVTGSGLPMRFAAADGTLVDIYQAATQMPDTGQAYPETAESLLDAALGPEGYFGAFTANAHNDSQIEHRIIAAQIVAAAQGRGVPVVSGRQLLEWLDARNASSFANLDWSAPVLSFTLTRAAGARNLRAMLPTTSSAGWLSALSRDGIPVASSTETVKGISYAVFDAQSGSYVASYGGDISPPQISGLAAAEEADWTERITWTTDEAATSRVDYGTSPSALSVAVVAPGFETSHELRLTGLLPATAYFYRVSSADVVGNAVSEPTPPAQPRSFTTPGPPCFADDSEVGFEAGFADGNSRVVADAGGAVMLAPAEGLEFEDSAPLAWPVTLLAGGGIADVLGGMLRVDGARIASNAAYGPARSLEFEVTFGGALEDVGFDAGSGGPRWATFGTDAAGTALHARSHDGMTETTTLLGGSLVGGVHRYRIAWSAGFVDFFVDGQLLASHPVDLTGTLGPFASDSAVDGASLSIDWIRMSPFAPAGSFVSRVGDGGVPSHWGPLAYDVSLPPGASAELSARTGSTSAPDSFWTPWVPISASGSAFGLVGRYVQYRVDFATSDPAASPVLHAVTLGCTTAADADSDGDGLADVVETSTSPLAPDSDGDGFNDGFEGVAGTDPLDAASVPRRALLVPAGPLGGGAAKRANAVSPDGSALVGLAATPSGDVALLWRLAPGSSSLGDLGGGVFASEAFDVAVGGAVAVGQGTSTAGREAFRWTPASGMLPLGDLAGGVFESRALGVSGDGSVVVGAGAGVAGEEAFRWTAGGDMQGLGDLAGGTHASAALGVSGDGSVVVGVATGANGPEAFRWSAPTGMLGLGDLTAGTFASIALDVSANGVAVVGRGAAAHGPLAFLWTQANAMVPLGELAGGAFGSEAHGVSADGSVAVGTSEGASGTEAFVWTQASGLRRLAELAVSDFGIDLAGWDRLVVADSVSDDGKVIVGYGLRGGSESAFVAYLTGDCNDGIDNDGDQQIDHTRDAGCSSTLDRSEQPECADGFDNDGDGLTDYPSDPGCANGLAAAREAPPCSNGQDDDLDGSADWPADVGCASRPANSESPQCQDGIDNDGAPGTDFDGGVSVRGAGNGDPQGSDPQCTSPTGTLEAAPPPSFACGLGAELLPALGLLLVLRRRFGPSAATR
jgi:probable HAF family extracellular repeat protein